MIRKIFHRFYVISIIILITLFTVQSASAKTVIADPANTLSIDELEQITSDCDTITEHFDTSIYITITKEMGSKDDYQKYMNTIGNDKDTPKNLVFLFISTKKNASIIYITSYGVIKDKMTQKRCDRIASNIEHDIEDGKYYDALHAFTNTIHDYLGKSPTLDIFLFKVFPHIILSIALAVLLLYLMLHFKAPETNGPLKTYLNAKESKIYGRLDHFTELEEVRTQKKTLKEYITSLRNRIATFFMPLWDKVYEHIEPYIATYQKKRRDKKREKEKTKGKGHKKNNKKGKINDDDHGNDISDEFEYGDATLKTDASLTQNAPKRNTSGKANVVSKDLINEVARMNAKDK